MPTDPLVPDPEPQDTACPDCVAGKCFHLGTADVGPISIPESGKFSPAMRGVQRQIDKPEPQDEARRLAEQVRALTAEVSRLEEVNFEQAKCACNTSEYGHVAGDLCLYHSEIMAQAESRGEERGRRQAADAVLAACGNCDGHGYTEVSRAVHACGGDDSLCATRCPVEELAQEGCEYCGRPIEAIRALSESPEKP